MNRRAEGGRGRSAGSAGGDAEAEGEARGAARDTASRLLRAALELFARRGYDGASLRSITARAESNLGAVAYHYGSKSGLYEAVVAWVVGPLREAATRAAHAPGPPLERVEGIVRAFFAHLERRPELPQLMLQRLAAGQPIPKPAAVTIQHNLGMLVSLIREGQKDGTIREGDPALMALSVVAQPLHLSLAGGAIGEAGMVDPTDPESRRKVVEHAVAFVRAGLAAGRTG
ncbi:MAG: TetR/AcrR family transcriptional regulator [Gemmatimonadota bacterium]